MTLQKYFLSGIKDLKYNANTEILTVMFYDGEVYNHYGVPYSLYSDLTKASIRGYFLHDRIRNKYPHSRVSNF